MPKALVGHAICGDFPEPQKRWGNAWPHREPQIFPKTFFRWYMELNFLLIVYICRFNIIYDYFLSLYVYISLIINIYIYKYWLYMWNHCSDFPSWAWQHGDDGLRLSRSSTADKTDLAEGINYAIHKNLEYHEILKNVLYDFTKNVVETSLVDFFAAQDDTFSFHCLWCCRISSPCAYLLWKVCLATMVWRAWEPCRRVRNGHKSSGKWIGLGNHRKTFYWLSCRYDIYALIYDRSWYFDYMQYNATPTFMHIETHDLVLTCTT